MSLLRSRLPSWRRWADHALQERDPARDRREAALLGLATLFVLVNSVGLNLARGGAWRWATLGPPAVWLVVSLAAHLLIRTLKPHRDPYLLPVYVLLAGWGLLLQERLASNFLGRQTLWYVLATTALVLVAVLPRSLQALMRYRYVLLVAGLLAVAITLLFGVNPTGSGAALWLPIPVPILGTIYFQPSEPLKVLLVIFLASYFTEQEPLYRYRKQAARRNDGEQRPGVLRRIARLLPFLGPLVLMWGFCLLLLVWQQDLGAAALFFIIFVALLYLATGERAYVGSGLLLLAAAGVFSDFALAAIAEEWGLVGSLSVIAAFAILALRGLRTALLALQGVSPRFFHAYLAAGLVVLFSVQTVLIAGGVIKLLPLTGITLPFISYGGSSLVVSGVMVGLLLYLSAANDRTLLARAYDRRLARRIERLALAILVGFAALALTLTYWSVVRSDTLAARTDNPRLVEAERRVQRGRILDRDGAILAESVAINGALGRVYPVAEVGPAVGYYSVRFGAAGIEQALDATLRGQTDGPWAELRRRWLHTTPMGSDVQLTLDVALQTMATEQMAGHTGGLVLLEVTSTGDGPEAAVRALVSQPTYDPNRLDEQYESLAAEDPGPLFNRATQGLYQPGLIVQPFLTAAAVAAGDLSLDDPVADPFLPVTLGGHVQRCAEPRTDDTTVLTWADMGRLRCPAPLQALGEQLGAAALQDAFAQFGLTEPPALPIPTAAGTVAVDDPGLAAIGQDTLTVSPLQAALAAASLASDGRLPAPRLVVGVNDATAGRQPWPGATAAGQGVPAAAAEAMRATWPVTGNLAEFSVSTLAGPGGQRNTWYLGLAPAGNPRYVIALVLEDEADTATAAAIGRAVLEANVP